MSVIDQLRQARLRKGLSCQDVGARMYTCHSSIAGWESGRVTPGLLYVERWAAVLGLRLVVVTDSTRRGPESRLCIYCGTAPVGAGRNRYCGDVCRRARKADRSRELYRKKVGRD